MGKRLAALLVFAFVGCGSGKSIDPPGGTGGIAGGSGGVTASGGVTGTGGRGTGGAASPSGPFPVDAAVVEAGAACGSGLPVCGSEDFCAEGSFNGAKVVHNCLPRGGCNDCGCMFEIIDAYVEQTGSWYVPGDCWCTGHVDGTVTSIVCNVG